MIEPVTTEEEWFAALSGVSNWIPPNIPTVLVSPHPDDETLGAGGLIAALRSNGVEVVIAAVTDGEAAYPDNPGLSARRIVEQREALRNLGVESSKIMRFGLPDSNVASRQSDLVQKLSELVSSGTHLIAPWVGDFHPDHEACGQAAIEVAERTGALLSSYFFWTWHWGTPASIKDLKLGNFRITPDLQVVKSKALLCHESQLVRPGGDPILPENLLEPARRRFETFAIA